MNHHTRIRYSHVPTALSSNKGSGVSVPMHRLARAFAAYIQSYMYVKTWTELETTSSA